ncbi:hypothetical protein D3C87_569920 [compost metagenome]|uniref:DUF6881 domain-containing protein n=1 Tax=Janthinobacterium sp. HH104 TaxID=1537276 RepID=UPI0008749B6B|nr:hypothetical protein [Janthinobacterium sp. HH104]OEZ85113.1 hypothetical protein JAB6_19600 [Janthinobacterium sp. HH104]
MRYIDVTWFHENKADPVRLMSELDRNGYETRKLEFFIDGGVGFAHVTAASMAVELGSVPVPPLDEINAHAEFSGVEICQADFEQAWRQALGNQC